jgi:hypothetical protein
MRKTALSLGSALVLCLAGAMPALADSSLPQPHGGPDVLGTGGTAGGGAGGTAFTGSNISLALVALAILVIAGASLLALRRLRAIGE